MDIQRNSQHWVPKTKTDKTKNTTQKSEKMSNTDLKKTGVKPGAHEV
jgi:hypothetical protein